MKNELGRYFNYATFKKIVMGVLDQRRPALIIAAFITLCAAAGFIIHSHTMFGITESTSATGSALVIKSANWRAILRSSTKDAKAKGMTSMPHASNFPQKLRDMIEDHMTVSVAA